MIVVVKAPILATMSMVSARPAEVARIVFGSCRTRIDRAEEILKQVLAEHGASD